MSNYYEVLDIDKNANQDEIKQAYKKKASENHPDRIHGSHKNMALINNAYSCLSDDERRKQYDKTGEDKRKPNFEVETMNALLQLFSEALEAEGNLIDLCNGSITDAIEKGDVHIGKLKAKITKLQTRKKAIKIKRGHQNRLHDLINQQIDRYKTDIERMKYRRKVVMAVKKELKNYSSDEEVFQQISQCRTWSTTTE